ncbi:FkbM family methyltransferase [Chloroflexota bacterium]|nr:FkbM family methyltransferase [Chloroflexota bacterium]
MRFLKKWAYYFWSVFEIIGGIRNWPAMLGLLLRRKDVSEHEVILRNPPVRLAIRGGMDLWAVKETFLDKFYTKYGVAVQEGWMVVDIGAGVGDFSILAAYSHPSVRVIAYEPFAGSFELLGKNIATNRIENIFPFEQAVWSERGMVTLDQSTGEPLQISSNHVDEAEKSGGSRGVSAISLQDVLDKQTVERIDLLKLDCEGAEYPILMGASNETLAKVDRIIMEYHDLDEEHNHMTLSAALLDAGYRVFCWENIVHEDIGYLFATREG